MDSRVLTALLTIALPVVLMGITIWKFASNPLAMLGLISVMVVGGFYLLTYRESFGA